jgi:hypothetical protein
MKPVAAVVNDVQPVAVAAGEIPESAEAQFQNAEPESR